MLPMRRFTQHHSFSVGPLSVENPSEISDVTQTGKKIYQNLDAVIPYGIILPLYYSLPLFLITHLIYNTHLIHMKWHVTQCLF